MFEIYRRAFVEGNTSIWWGEETITRSWDPNTMYMYFVIVIFAFFIGRLIDKKKARLYNYCLTFSPPRYPHFKNIKLRLCLFFFVLALILGCRHYTVGIDTIVYRNTIDNAVSLSQMFEDSTTEPLYKILQYLLHAFIGSGTIGILLYAVATLFFIYKGISCQIGNINICVALLAFTCIYYFPAMNLLRISLAASIVFGYMHYFMEGRYSKFYIAFVIAFLLHYSTLALLVPLGMYHIYIRNKRIAMWVGMLLVATCISTLTVLSDYIALISRYTHYIESNESSGRIGIMLFIDYLPAIYIVFYIIKNRIKGKWADLTICFTCAALFIRFLAYYITVFGRLHTQFMFLSIVLIPYWVFYMQSNKSSNYMRFKILCFAWTLLRLHVYFTSYLASDGIMPYKFMWG